MAKSLSIRMRPTMWIDGKISRLDLLIYAMNHLIVFMHGKIAYWSEMLRLPWVLLPGYAADRPLALSFPVLVLGE